MSEEDLFALAHDADAEPESVISFQIFPGTPETGRRIEATYLEEPIEPEPVSVEAEPVPEVPVAEGQGLLFDLAPLWEIEWQGMPEFRNEDLEPERSLIVHFESAADVRKFAEAIGQPVGPNVKSLWFPEAEIVRYADKRYADAGAQ